MEYPGWFHIWTLCCNHNVAFGKAFVVWRCVQIVKIIGVYWSVSFFGTTLSEKKGTKAVIAVEKVPPQGQI